MQNFYTPKEIAHIMRISYQSALLFIRFSGIPYQRVGRQYRVSVEIFDDFTKKTVSTNLQ